MKWKELLDKWSLSGVTINAGFIEIDFSSNDIHKNASWEMYIEMQTRITTQDLDEDEGDEASALESIAKLFQITIYILKKYGKHSSEFSRIALFILNEKIRLFTSKWHKLSVNGAFNDNKKCQNVRKELKELQVILKGYNLLLADMAGVEDLHIYQV
jgi:hypothetical protein